eukprot:1458339-Rhodomonas_salina.3
MSEADVESDGEGSEKFEQVSPYGLATLCPAMPCSDRAYIRVCCYGRWSFGLRASYAMSGSDLVHAATGSLRDVLY